MFLKLLKFVWLFESMTSEDLDYNAQVIWCFLAFITQEQREHPSKHLLLCSTEERKSHGFERTVNDDRTLICVCLWQMKALPHTCPLGSGTHPPLLLSSLSLHLSLSTQHPHSVILRVKDGSFETLLMPDLPRYSRVKPGIEFIYKNRESNIIKRLMHGVLSVKQTLGTGYLCLLNALHTMH